MPKEFKTLPLFSTFEQETLPHKSGLYQAAYSLLRSQGEAEDAVQETYLQAWKSFNAFQPGTNCRAWMFSILLNVIRHQRRKWVCRFCLTNEPSLFEKILPATERVHDDLSDPDILAAFRRLPPPYAEAVLLTDVQEFSYKEVSDVIGRPIGTVMSRVSRGRELLRQALAPIARQRGLLKAKPAEAIAV